MRHALLITALCLGLPLLPAAAAGDERTDEAARSFETGQQLYNLGKYEEALAAFARANNTVPHPSALFNIARCHENLGRHAAAMEAYASALQAETDATRQADIRRRMANLRKLPVEVFVTTSVPGARVTVDARDKPEEGVTPLLVRLEPGAHLLLLARDGYRLATRRVKVEVGKKQAIQVDLEPMPRPCPDKARTCPKPKPVKCPVGRLVNAHRLRMQAGLLAAFGLSKDRVMVGGPGVQFHLIYRRILVGAHLLFFPLGEESIEGERENIDINKEIRWTSINHRWIQLQVEGGYVFPFENWYTYITLGLGMNLDQAGYDGVVWYRDGNDLGEKVGPVPRDPIKKDPNDPETRDRVFPGEAFAWSVGGGLHVAMTTWFSMGMALRFGMIHGERVEKESPKDSVYGHFPYGNIWAVFMFHL